MKTPISDETLTNYLFELLDDNENKKVEAELANCPSTQKRLKRLRIKFNQLQVLESSKRPAKGRSYYPILAIAAIIALTFLLKPTTPQISEIVAIADTAAKDSYSQDDKRMIFLESFSEPKETFSLLNKFEAPLKETIDLKIPEVRIQYDDENYEIVDLRTYESLNLPSEFIEEQQNNFEQILSLK